MKPSDEPATAVEGQGTDTSYNVEHEVRRRYAGAAVQVEPALCCPITEYDGRYLDCLPREILEKDYGCGDPSKHIREGETVVDLGSGAGKICYILAQKVGPDGKVIGVDFNDVMLDLARRHQPDTAAKIGYDNVRFVKGRIQDLALDMQRVDAFLGRHPIRSSEDLAALEAECERLRAESPLIENDSVDAVVSNCVLNLVRTDQKRQLFAELFRVLKRGGRAVISDIVSDEDPTAKILNDPELWSGCIAGAFQEDAFLKMFEEAGFYGAQILDRSAEPWRTIDGVEFRSVTVRAFKGKEGPCLERNQAVIYTGPWKQVRDDDGHLLQRGSRMAVCDKTFHIYTDPNGPYSGDIVPVPPLDEVPGDEAKPFNCRAAAVRHPRQTKGQDYDATTQAQACCEDGEDCC
jgi:arsenite methyltransferase